MEANPILKKCPYCAEDILADAIKCRHCKEMLTSPPHEKKFNNYADSAAEDKVSTAEKAGYRLGKVIKRTGIIVAAIIIVAVLVYNYQQNGSAGGALSSAIALREKSPDALRMELADVEKSNPQDYLEDHTTMKKNLIGEEVIEGTVTNKSSVAVYKDVVLNVTFMSKTEADLGSKQFTVYEVIAPGQSATFKFKTFAPDGTKAFAVAITGAGAGN